MRVLSREEPRVPAPDVAVTQGLPLAQAWPQAQHPGRPAVTGRSFLGTSGAHVGQARRRPGQALD